jgi:hypothetical protein
MRQVEASISARDGSAFGDHTARDAIAGIAGRIGAVVDDDSAPAVGAGQPLEASNTSTSAVAMTPAGVSAPPDGRRMNLGSQFNVLLRREIEKGQRERPRDDGRAS